MALTGALLAAVAIPTIWLWNRHRVAESLSPRHVLPWSVLLQDGRHLQLVLADPDISAMQELTGSQISLPDYANRRYPANPEAFGSDMQKALRLLRGVNVAAVDVGIALSFSRLAASSSAKLKVNTARSLQLSAFGTDDDFIILGSPAPIPGARCLRTNWTLTLSAIRSSTGRIVRNRASSLANYRATSQRRGDGTPDTLSQYRPGGESEPSRQSVARCGYQCRGHQAAGQFLTNTAQLARTLQAHGIDPGGPPCHFEILLQVRTMAGSPSTIEVVACHRLSARHLPDSRIAPISCPPPRSPFREGKRQRPKPHHQK